MEQAKVTDDLYCLFIIIMHLQRLCCCYSTYEKNLYENTLVEAHIRLCLLKENSPQLRLIVNMYTIYYNNNNIKQRIIIIYYLMHFLTTFNNVFNIEDTSHCCWFRQRVTAVAATLYKFINFKMQNIII